MGDRWTAHDSANFNDQLIVRRYFFPQIPQKSHQMLMDGPFWFAVLRDPAGWLSVNPVKGTVNTTGTLDRESPHVHNNRYSAVFMATDNVRTIANITLEPFGELFVPVISGA
ncbi:cadherin-13 [Tachysurus ichikawai]